MQFVAVINRDGGTMRTIDLDDFCARMRETLEASGHSLEIDLVAGDGLIAGLKKAAATDADVVLAGGGDGTISAAAGILMDSGKALAVLPAGTMNLFARSLGIPLSLDEAVAALATAPIRQVDIASANGRPFVHQFSVGMHARLIDLRSRMEFASRLGKIGASARAAIATLRNPPALDVSLLLGETEIVARSTAIGITNNLFGEGHLPYAERPDGGVLGVYVTVARARSEILSFVLNMARGRWRDNQQVEIHQSEEVTLTIRSRRRKLKAAIDGELCELSPETHVRIHPGALSVVAPAASSLARAA
ncbi:MAG: diacylglycerol kinase family lipid kinase [Alphaproteobacteria bacterium]|jgi:diacylglycerol kinase family enzyme|nr:diacylglycerol kinase family lipid kinase [Alphaproteobacteria bacterium]MBU0805088.1 diacylglycerol kinase family lipid kinase [Alphaproteobacteria bacterium]MBU0870587.1 diacylglycerol kinase family lipid kinase [Alphaproteobacteria bacterium]MBU1401738.1 diacylglycerol kinase family lipid kinase [Alphaproteobacteria bacterium]MBU1591845.1 diacylglycerol kinase family lipid kinase [Alphaproteobacteria bacterium]